MKTTTPPTSDAIAPSDAAIAQAFRDIAPSQFTKASHFHEYVLGRARLLDSGEMPWHQEWANVQSRNESARQRAREIAAQHGEGGPPVAQVRCSSEGPHGTLYAGLIPAGPATPEVKEGDLLYLHPPHAADALDGERDTLVGALLDEWEFKTDSDLAHEMRENGIGARLDALLTHMNDPELRT